MGLNPGYLLKSFLLYPQFYNPGNIAEYEGDSYQNIIGDLIAVQSGYMVSWIFFHFGICAMDEFCLVISS